MKQSDIFALILIAGIGTLAAFLVCNAIMGNPDEAVTKFKALDKVISKDLTVPNPEIFNVGAVNPTIEVYVGNCEDIDQNGILDQWELMACGRVQNEQRICADINGDGFLSINELRDCNVTIVGDNPDCEDINRDGMLDASERSICNILLQGEEANVEGE